MTNLDSVLKSRDITNRGLYSQSYGFSGSHVWMWELDYKESWAPKNWCFWTLILEKTLENPLDIKEIKPINPKDDQSWIFIERTDVEAEALVIGHLMWRTDSLEKTLMLGKIEAKGKVDDRGWDGRMGSLTRWAWVWVSSRCWWWTVKPGMLQSLGSQRVGHDWATELNRTFPTSQIYCQQTHLVFVCLRNSFFTFGT